MTRKKAKRLKAISPGDLLWHEFMAPLGLTRYRLAKEISVPAQRIGDIINGKRSITADTDLRLSKFFGLSNGYWLRAQAIHDLEVAEYKIKVALKKIRPLRKPAA